MTTQPKALRLADRLDLWGDQNDLLEAAAELRRQHDEIEQLNAERDALLAEVERLKGVNYDSCAGEKEMTRDDIIRMAREAGFSQPWTAPKETQDRLARFASLIAAAERKTRALEKEPVAWVKHDGEIVVRIDYGGRLYYSEQNIYTADVVRKAIEAEREACAKVCEQMETYGDPVQCWLDQCAAAIRTRSKT